MEEQAEGKKKYEFSDFSALWEEEMGKGRMSWMGKGDWVVIGIMFGGLAICQFLSCTGRMPVQNWFSYWLVGAGIFWILSGALRILVPAWRRGLLGLFTPGLFFGTLGIMLVKGWGWWPVIVLAVGLQAGITVIYTTMRKHMLAEEQGKENE